MYATKQLVAITLVLLFLVGCGGSSSSSLSSIPTRRVYNATASVGDFVVITVDETTHTIAFDNRTYGQTGTFSYTLAEDGGYVLTGSDGESARAYEIPGLALILQGTQSGPNGDEPALLMAFEQQAITKADLANRQFSFVKLQTKNGGVEAGHIEFDASANLFLTSYFPAGLVKGGGNGLFQHMTVPENLLVNDPNLGAVLLGGAQSGVIFGTQGGNFAIDAGDGSLLGWPEAASKDFDPLRAGTYKTVLHMKHTVAKDGVETDGEVEMQPVDVAVSAGGHIRIVSGSETLVDTDLIPFEDSGLYGYGDDMEEKVTRQCKGLFVFPAPGSRSNALVFIVFMDQALVLATIDYTVGIDGSINYSYVQGVGLTNPSFVPVPATGGGGGSGGIKPMPVETLRTLGDFAPFPNYELDTTTGLMKVWPEGEEAAPVYGYMLPFLVHAPRFTGHQHGKVNAQWGLYYDLDGSLVESLGDGQHGVKKSVLEDRVPWYTAPADATVVNLVQYSYDGASSVPDWRIVLQLTADNRVKLSMEHLTALDEELMDALVAAGNPDPRTWSASTPAGGTGSSGELIKVPLDIPKGTRIGRPGLLGGSDRIVPDHPDYLFLDYGGSSPPPTATGTEGWGISYEGTGVTYNTYSLLPEATRSKIVEAWKATLDIPLFGPRPTDQMEFWWRAEIRLGPDVIDGADYSSLVAGKGSWYESHSVDDDKELVKSGYTRGDPLNDQVVAFIPISKEPGIYKPELYSPGASHLMQSYIYDPTLSVDLRKDNWKVGEILTPAVLDPVAGSALVKWRYDLGTASTMEQYQTFSYRIVAASRTMLLRWGGTAGSAAAGAQLPFPAIPAADAVVDGSSLCWFNY